MSAEKTLDILDLYDFDARALTVAQIAEKLGQPQSSVYRHLRVLKEKGYIIETSDNHYKLGYRFLKMARIVRKDHGLMVVSRPEMEKLNEETKETIILSVRSNFHAVCLEVIPSLYPIKVSSEQGGVIPLHCGASSKVLLSSLEESFIDQLYEMGLVKKYLENTLYEKQALIEDLQRIRENGYAFSDSEIDEGVLSYSVPIRDFNEKVVASLSIAGPSERMLQQDKHFYVEKLIETTKRIERYL
ncbi:IclR family transcriptional regulator [Neobacillus drentensis]|uniref:IclR family transcriptional regulator n=1 Tax=Neobacillus drentensis TaxID=220684 RepID=UPI002FFDB617